MMEEYGKIMAADGRAVVMDIRARLDGLAEADYRAFSSRLLPGTENILGVRLPALRKLAKELACGDWRAYAAWDQRASFEEIMIHGMLLGYVSIDFEQLKVYISEFIPWIDNWSVCDSCCVGLKAFRDHPEDGWEFLAPYAASEKEYEARFAMVVYLNHYVNHDIYGTMLPAKVSAMKAQGYYAQMAAAWLLAECYVNSKTPILELLRSGTLDLFIHNKTISKICESRKVPAEEKAELKGMRRKA